MRVVYEETFHAYWLPGEDAVADIEAPTEEEIGAFCRSTYDVTFPLFAKVDVNGDNAHPLYQHLKSAQPGILGTEAIKWNFTKFLIDKEGHVVKRFAPKDTPEEIAREIEVLL